MGKTTVTIKNVQCVDEAELTIFHNTINIRFGHNGLGKSSIGKGIETALNNPDNIESLTPFGSDKIPEVTFGNGHFSKSLSFNKEYLDNVVLTKKSALPEEESNKFYLSDIRIEESRQKLNSRLEKLRDSVFAEIIEKYLEIARPFSADLFKENKEINTNSSSYKGLNKGANIDAYFSYDDEIKRMFNLFLESDIAYEWIKWRSEIIEHAKKYDNLGACPYCGKPDFKSDDYEVFLKKLGDFKADARGKARASAEALIHLAKEEDKSKLSPLLTTNPEKKISNEMKDLIRTVGEYLMGEIYKIDYLKKIDTKFDGSEDALVTLEKSIKESILNVDIFNEADDSIINKPELIEAVKNINKEIEELLDDFGTFKKDATEYNDLISNSINTSKNEIDSFLGLAGIPYKFKVEKNEEKIKTYISHINAQSEQVNEPGKHLSYGEHNSFALALFGALAKKADDDTLIILDDPISSFDENKKFAVLHFLFNKEDGVLRNKTVLMLTHDNETVIDLFKKDFLKVHPNAALLVKTMEDRRTQGEKDAGVEANLVAVVREEVLEEKSIIFTANNEMLAAKDKNLSLYARLVHLRRANEFFEEKYKNKESHNIYLVLSNAEKLVDGVKKTNNKASNMLDDDELAAACSKIASQIGEESFNYDDFIKHYFSFKTLYDEYDNSSTVFEKLCLIRAMVYLLKIKYQSKYEVNTVVMNFILGAFHIDNLNLYSIKGLESLPPYIEQLCDGVRKELGGIVH